MLSIATNLGSENSEVLVFFKEGYTLARGHKRDSELTVIELFWNFVPRYLKVKSHHTSRCDQQEEVGCFYTK